MKNLLKLLFALLIGALPLAAQSVKASSDPVAEPREVTYCELAQDPAAYDRELVRLTAFVTHGFEDFQLAEPNCPNLPQNFSVVRRQNRIGYSLLLSGRSRRGHAI
jgi:hypothetical protein